jgi:hypothetical protein
LKNINNFCQIGPIKSVQNPHETRIWPNSRARIWPNLAHANVRFAVAKTTFLKKIVVFFTSTVPGPPGKTCTGSIPHLWRGLFTRNVSSAKAIRGFRPSATGTSEANARRTRLMNTAGLPASFTRTIVNTAGLPCKFHQDHRGSFHMTPSKNEWHHGWCLRPRSWCMSRTNCNTPCRPSRSK